MNGMKIKGADGSTNSLRYLVNVGACMFACVNRWYGVSLVLGAVSFS